MYFIRKFCIALLFSIIILIFCSSPVFSLVGNGTQCGGVNSSFTLTANLTVNGTCYIINASNIIIDCAGFTLTGNGTGDGVNLTDFDNITVRNCNLINFQRGIAKDTFSWNSDYIIENNVITTSAYEGDAIVLIMGVNSTIHNNTLTTTGNNSHGIGLNPGINESVVTSNIITTFGNLSFGIFPAGCHNSNFSNNIITTHGMTADGIDLPGSFGNIFDNNTITVYGEGGGIDTVYGSSNNIISNNNISIFGDSSGLELTENATNNTFINNIVYTDCDDCTAFEIWNGAYNNTIIGGILNATNSPDIFIEYAGDNNVFLNVTFNKSDIEFEDSSSTGSVVVKWYLSVETTFNGAGEENVTINVTSDDFNGSDTTNSSGLAQFELTEFVQNATAKVYSGLYNINATKQGFAKETEIINLSQSTSISFELLQQVNACGLTLTNDTALNQSLSCAAPAFTIGADNVILDCKNNSITSLGGNVGIDVSNVDNITIRNCRIYGFGTAGIYYYNSSFGLVEYNDVSNQTASHGIVMGRYSQNNTIRFNTANYNQMTGLIAIENTSAYNTFSNNTAIGNKDHGMEIENGAHHNYFIDNSIFNSNYTGIKLSPATHSNIVHGNFINITNNQGINLENSSGNIIDGNRVYNNPGDAITIGDNSSNNIIKNNYLKNFSHGVSLFMEDSANILNNTFIQGDSGIFIVNCTNLSVSENIFSSLTNEMHMLYNSSNITVFNNVFSSKNKQILFDGVNWDNGSIGNRWTSFDQPAEGCEDANSDGICDSSYSIGGDYTDNLPIALVTGAVTVSGGNNNGGNSPSTSSSMPSSKPKPVMPSDVIQNASMILLTDVTRFKVKENVTVSFSIKTSSELNFSNHSLILNNVTNASAAITISSTPQTATLHIGESKAFDIDSDLIFDINATLKDVNVTLGFADLSVRLLTFGKEIVLVNETLSVENISIVYENEVKEQEIPWVVIIAFIILASAYIPFYIYYPKKKKKH